MFKQLLLILFSSQYPPITIPGPDFLKPPVTDQHVTRTTAAPLTTNSVTATKHCSGPTLIKVGQNKNSGCWFNYITFLNQKMNILNRNNKIYNQLGKSFLKLQGEKPTCMHWQASNGRISFCVSRVQRLLCHVLRVIKQIQLWLSIATTGSP